MDGTAVGFVNVSTDINTDILKENFELKIFNYFLKKVEKTKEGKKTIISLYNFTILSILNVTFFLRFNTSLLFLFKFLRNDKYVDIITIWIKILFHSSYQRETSQVCFTTFYWNLQDWIYHDFVLSYCDETKQNKSLNYCSTILFCNYYDIL